ncbi:MAG: YceI family protein [Acetobacteraceae bacterium]|jgi:polyisoprenoid-binding protein YceI|nr:YceI family protein [Acetobacteraceae bacterium]
MRRFLPLLLALPLAAAAAPTAPSSLAVAVTPACCAITFTAYAFGIFPIEGGFARFEGSLIVPEGGAARAEARIDAASLSLDGGPIEADVKSPRFLDVSHYRHIVFSAAAAQPWPLAPGATLSGSLTIKDVTRPVTLTLRREEAMVTAEALISRSAFGMTARPLLAGDTVAIRVTAPITPR